MEKFVQEFRSVEVMQVRMNGCCCRVTLGKEKGSFSVVKLDFREECKGSIAVCNPLTPGFIRVHLYREEPGNTLRLVG
jgi:hypothetical protein